MRLPNGYGSVVKMSGNRRRPYAVRKTDGFNEKGYPIYKIIGYTETKEEGLSLLAKYNESPWNINEQKLLFVDCLSGGKRIRSRNSGIRMPQT